MPRRPRLRVGLTGCAGIAWSAHVPALQQLAPRVEVAMVAEIRSETAAAIARAVDRDWTAGYRVVLDDTSIDAVVICTPEIRTCRPGCVSLSELNGVTC